MPTAPRLLSHIGALAIAVASICLPAWSRAKAPLPDWTACASQPPTKFHHAATTERRTVVRVLLDRVDREQRCMQIMAGALPADRPRLWTTIGSVQRSLLRSNAAWLKLHLRRYPLLDTRFSDAIGSEAAWLVVQHADHAPAWQRSVLPTIERLTKLGRFNRQQSALLTDRVAVNAGHRQIYGSQGQCGPDARWHPKAIADPSGLDRRREAAGLEPISAYIARFTC